MKRLSLVLVVAIAAISALLVLSPQTSGKSEKLIKHENSVPGRYIVVFEPDSVQGFSTEAEMSAVSHNLAAEYNAAVDKVWESAVQGFSAEMSAKDAERLSRDPRVKLVEEDMIAYAGNIQSSADWGLDRIDQRGLPLNGAFTYAETGQGVNVYVIDSGIRPTHVDFGGRAAVAFDAVNDGQNGIDCHGHGTHVAGTVASSTYGVAKQANVYGVRVLACNGSGLVSNIITGVNWVKNNRVNPAVVNMSLWVSAVSSTLDSAINSSVASGVTHVVAAGNRNLDACNYSPSSASSALVVAATGSDDAKASYSNWGTCVDLFAPGSGITSLGHSSDTATRSMSGTSMSSPMVAGAAALYLETNPTASPAAVMNRILADSTSGVVSGLDTVTPNKMLYSWLGDSQPPTPGSVTIIKEVFTLDGGTASTEPFTYTAANIGTSGFTLVDNDAPPDDRYVNPSVFVQNVSSVITVVEEEKLGWMLSSIECTETAGEGIPNQQNSTTDMATRSATLIIEEGESVTCRFVSTQIAPTSAPVTVSGRVLDQDGVAVRLERVMAMNAFTGETEIAFLNSFGYFVIEGLTAGETYFISVADSKRHTFSPSVIQVTPNEDLYEINFTGTTRTN
jgi:aqualysin 1